MNFYKFFTRKRRNKKRGGNTEKIVYGKLPSHVHIPPNNKDGKSEPKDGKRKKVKQVIEPSRRSPRLLEKFASERSINESKSWEALQNSELKSKTLSKVKSSRNGLK